MYNPDSSTTQACPHVFFKFCLNKRDHTLLEGKNGVCLSHHSDLVHSNITEQNNNGEYFIEWAYQNLFNPPSDVDIKVASNFSLL